MTKADIRRKIVASKAGAATASSRERIEPCASAMKPFCGEGVWGSDGASTNASNKRDRNALTPSTLARVGSRKVNELRFQVNFGALFTAAS